MIRAETAPSTDGVRSWAPEDQIPVRLRRVILFPHSSIRSTRDTRLVYVWTLHADYSTPT